jgi:hypothetical protein
MSLAEELEKKLQSELMAEFETHLQAVRGCPMTPGSLEPILTRAAERMARLTQETLARAASEEADFPPSGESSLRRGTALQSDEQAAPDRDGLGPD